MKVVKITDSKWKVTLLTDDVLEMGFRPETVLEDKRNLFGLIRQAFIRMKEDYNEIFAENVVCEVVRERDILVLILTKSITRSPEELMGMVTEQAPVMEPLNPIHFEEDGGKNESPYSMFSSDWDGEDTEELDLIDMLEAESGDTIQNRMENLLSDDEEDSETASPNTGKQKVRKNSLSKRKARNHNEQMMLMVETHDFENLLALAKTLHSIGIVDSSMYNYRGKYVLWLTDLNMTKSEWQNLKAVALEYMSLSFESEHVLNEYGKTLIDKNAIGFLTKTFHKED